jgi:AcrR family transcriptional regulator
MPGKKPQRRGETAAQARLGVLWHERARSARGPAPTFRLDDVVRAGIDIADRRGLSALTMAAAATRLRVSTMALYRHVPSKDALIDLMADRVMRRPPRLAGSHWRANISTWARGNLTLLRRHPWLIEVISTRSSVGPNWARWLEAGLQAIAPLPLSAVERIAVLLLVDGHCRAAAQLLTGARASTSWAANVARMLQAVAGDSRYPALTAMVLTGQPDGSHFDLDRMIEFGFERLVEGIAALVEDHVQ